MFTIEELSACLPESWFLDGYQALERNLFLTRLGQPCEPVSRPTLKQLKRFSQAVMSSAATWENPREKNARLLCQYAADIEASVSLESGGDTAQVHLSHLKAIFLYELAGLPGASSSHAARNGFDPRFRTFFTRENNSIWRSATNDWAAVSVKTDYPVDQEQSPPILFEKGLSEILLDAGCKLQAAGPCSAEMDDLHLLGSLAGNFDLGVTGDDVLALEKLVELRASNSTLAMVPQRSALSVEDLRAISAPVELWSAQAFALKEGLLDPELRSFGFAAPTGTGKTALARILIANALRENPGSKIFYICPSRALVHEVWIDLSTSLSGIGASVFEAGGHLTGHINVNSPSASPDVIVFTPERADLLLRVDPEFLAQTSLVIVDEAHHIEQGSRGILLELYLWRLVRMISPSARVIQLSAVAPNIAEMTSWLSQKNDTHAVMVDSRTSRLRVGLLTRTEGGAAELQLRQGKPYIVLPDGQHPNDEIKGLAMLANSMAKNSIVLVLCMSPGSAERVAEAVAALRSDEEYVDDDISERLDAWVERELYPESALRTHYKKRVLFHHAQMPPRVRLGIEEAIRERRVDIICATTTLAEGVNFPFSTVIVESLVGHNFQLTPRALWNIAGRAGRFGVDTEGLCILYRPELWTKRLKGYKIEDYLQTALADIPPVKSALAVEISKLNKLVLGGKISLEDLDSVSLSAIKIDGKATVEAKNVRALINIMRVGYAHASSTNIIDINVDKAPEYANQLFASHQLSVTERVFAEDLGKRQRRVVKMATDENPELIEIAAKVGWSLEAQSNIYNWLKTRDDWQLEQFGSLVVGGHILNLSNVSYLIGPVAKHLLAFDGEALGGAYSYLAEKWIAGTPLSQFKVERDASFGLMIAKIYGRMQYLLPWGLFGMHELLQYESKRRGLVVSDGVSALSVLAAEGVPNFDALTLTLSLGVERADATRLSEAFKRLRLNAPIVDWLSALPWGRAEEIVRGVEQRRVDPSFRALHRRLVRERMEQRT